MPGQGEASVMQAVQQVNCSLGECLGRLRGGLGNAWEGFGEAWGGLGRLGEGLGNAWGMLRGCLGDLGRLVLSMLGLSGEAWEAWGGLGGLGECLGNTSENAHHHQPPLQ